MLSLNSHLERGWRWYGCASPAAVRQLLPLRAEQPDMRNSPSLAASWLRRMCFQDAIRISARRLHPSRKMPAVSGLYQAQWSAGDRVAALDTARRWADARPDDHAARYNLGLLHLAGGDEESAIRELRTVVERLPNNVAALNNLALLLRDRNPREALGLAERAQRLMPDSVAVLDTLGSVQLSAGDGRAALGTLARALEIEPGHAMAISIMRGAGRERPWRRGETAARNPVVRAAGRGQAYGCGSAAEAFVVSFSAPGADGVLCSARGELMRLVSFFRAMAFAPVRYSSYLKSLR